MVMMMVIDAVDEVVGGDHDGVGDNGIDGDDVGGFM